MPDRQWGIEHRNRSQIACQHSLLWPGKKMVRAFGEKVFDVIEAEPIGFAR
jgi:hypothetical protein